MGKLGRNCVSDMVLSHAKLKVSEMVFINFTSTNWTLLSYEYTHLTLYNDADVPSSTTNTIIS